MKVIATLEGRGEQLARYWCQIVPDSGSRWPDLEHYLRALISGLVHVLRTGDWVLAQSVIDELAQRRHASGIATDLGVQRAVLAGRHAIRPLWGDDEDASACEDLFLETLHECVLRFSESYQGVRSSSETERMHTRIIKSLVMSLEARDAYTKGHSLSVAILAHRMADGVPGVDRTHVYLAGLLHDIGKIGIPDAVLQKPAPLDEKEWEIMRSHPALGAEILKPIKLYSDVTSAVLTHHENYDGSGYPIGLRGNDIPQIARILRVADSFDAMTSTRAHRGSKSVDQGIAAIAAGSGSLYHPEIADLFARIIEAPGAINELSLASLQIDLEEFVI
jgi:putative nucleotidyltransferase with HDIG domain